MKTTVITGGAGFIGSHLAQELADRNYRVIIIDDLSTGKLENITPLLDHGKVEFIQDSILNLPLLQKLFQGVDHVFHQAAIASVPRSLDDPVASHEANITGTLNVLIAARDNHVKKMVYAASCAVYGDTPSSPQKEDMPLNPQSPYAVTKLAAEYYCRVFAEVYGLPSACLRYFNVYGPRQDPNSQYAAAIPRFIKRAAEGEPPLIYGDGEQTRDFVFVKDVVEANIMAAESQASGIFNIGTGKSITVNELANLILSITGSKVKPVHQSPRAGEIRHSLADIAKARSFGYQPKYSLEAGLRQTIKESGR